MLQYHCILEHFLMNFDKKTKEIMLWGVVALVVLVGGYAVLQKTGVLGKTFFQQRDQVADLETIPTVSLQNYIDRDTDGDGLKDWEEGLWGTDPTLADSDQNGISDNVEVGNKKAVLAVSGGDDQSEGSLPNEKLTQTDAFSRELWATVNTLVESGNATPENLAKISEAAAQYIKNSGNINTYTLAEIKIASDNSQINFVEYLNRSGEVLSKNRLPGDNVAELFFSYLETKNMYYKLQLENNAKSYKSLRDGLLSATVPPDGANLHLNLVNSVNNVYEDLLLMLDEENDPLLAVSAVSQFNIHLDSLLSSLDSIKNYFRKIPN